MNEHDEILLAEAQMLDHACDVLTEGIGVQRVMNEANTTGRPAWRWAQNPGPVDALEAARAVRAFPPTTRP